MRILDFFLITMTTLLLTINQVLLKLWLAKYPVKLSPLHEIKFTVFLKPELLCCMVSFVAAGVIWITMLKRMEFSILYPMISLSYVFGLVAAKLIFHETIPGIRWLGVVLIISGIYIISKS